MSPAAEPPATQASPVAAPVGTQTRSRTTAAQLLVSMLIEARTECVFVVPGESFVAVLDALRDADSVCLVVCRHEAAAANMADAYGKLTGRPGVCFVSRGPGAAHASIGCHTAMQDATPMILFIGDVRKEERQREAFQELDFSMMFKPLSKRVMSIDEPHRVPELLSSAFRTAIAGRPGPVVVTIAEDVLSATTDRATTVSNQVFSRTANSVGPTQFGAIRPQLETSRRPLIVVGGSGWTDEVSSRLDGFATAKSLPVATAFRCQDVFDNESRAYVGHLGIGTSPVLWEYVSTTDLVVNIGARIDGPTSNGFRLLGPSVNGGHGPVIIQFHPDPEMSSKWPFPQFGVVCSVEDAVNGLTELAWNPAHGREESLANLRASLIGWRKPVPTSDAINLSEIVSVLPQIVGPDCIITNGAGDYTKWIHRYFSFRHVGSYLGPRNGAMGYGIPAAITAKLLRPSANVVAFAGDGCFMMASHELATIKRYSLAITIVVINNQSYGSIRRHQERQFPGRPYGTSLTNPDFVALAKAHGLAGIRVEHTSEFFDVVETAIALERSTLIEIRTQQSVDFERTVDLPEEYQGDACKP